MQKIIFIGILNISSFVAAETMQVETPFWQAAISSPLQVGLSNNYKTTDADCKEFRKSIDELRSQAKTYVNEELESLRAVPLAHQKSPIYEEFFEMPLSPLYLPNQSIDDGRLFKTPRNFIIDFSEAQLTPLSLKVDDDSLSAFYIERNLPASRWLFDDKTKKVWVRGKDLACDLLSGKAFFTAQIQNSTLKLDAESTLQMNKEFSEIEKIILKEVTGPLADDIKMAALSFELGQFLGSRGLSEDEQEEQLAYLYHNTFEPDSLILNSSWKRIGKRQFFEYTNEQTINEIEVVLRSEEK